MSKVNVQVVNRLRLVSAVLAGSQWPAYEQEQMGAHAVHPHAKATRHYVSDYADHPAVTTINALLPAGLDLSELFSTAVRCNWPTFEPQEPLPGRFSDGTWASQLGDFYVETALAAFFWAEQAAPWADAENDLRRIFNNDNLYQLLSQLSGTPPAQDLVIMPNLNYPALQAVVASNRDHIYLLLPPPKAVGESPPGPTGMASIGYWPKAATSYLASSWPKTWPGWPRANKRCCATPSPLPTWARHKMKLPPCSTPFAARKKTIYQRLTLP